MLFNLILASRPPAGSIRRWFSSHGVLLAIDASAKEFSAEIPDIEDALLLEKQEPLLHCVEHWLGSEFDWQPHEAAADSTLDITLTNRIGQKRQIGIALQTDLESGLPDVSAEVTELVCIARHAISLSIELDSFELSEEDKQRLAIDSLMLLPGSFSQSWQAKAGIKNDSRFFLRVALDATAGVMSYREDDISMYDFVGKDRHGECESSEQEREDGSDQPFRISVVLDRCMNIIRGIAAGDSSSTDCRHQFEYLHSEKVSVLADDGVVLFYGSLLRVGDGFAVKLEAAG